MSEHSHTTSGQTCSTIRASWRAAAPILAGLVVLAVLAARTLSPSDIHDQTQPKTIAYTTNIVTHAGDWTRWILPREIEVYPATKPPLYNWLAAPFVALTDGRYDWAHKAPSLLSFLALVVIVWMVAGRVDPGNGTTRAWAVIVFSSNYMWFKLSYLARPDSVLTVFIITGWVSATMLAIRMQRAIDQPERAGHLTAWRIGIWVSAALAFLAKGPPGVLIPLYLVVLFCFVDVNDMDDRAKRRIRDRMRPRFLAHRSWLALRASGAGWGIPLSLVPVAVWLALASMINPDHVYHVMFREEITDRLLGIGEEGTKSGPWDLVRTLPEMPWVFLTRFLPWSIFFIGALIDVAGRSNGNQKRGLPPEGESPRDPFAMRAWVVGGIVFTLMTVAVFSLSAGKRGDYIASVVIPASIVVAYWLNHLGFRLGRRTPWLPGAMAALTILGLGVYAWRFDYAVQYPLGTALHRFADKARPILEDAPDQPVAFYETGRNPVQALLNRSQSDMPEAVEKVAARDGSFWLFVRSRSVDSLMQEPWADEYRFARRAQSAPTPSNEDAEPVEIILFDVQPILRDDTQ